MANAFIDTSALVKYYHPEEGTQEVTQIIEEPMSRHYISRLSLVETVSAWASIMASATSLNEPPENSATRHH